MYFNITNTYSFNITKTNGFLNILLKDKQLKLFKDHTLVMSIDPKEHNIINFKTNLTILPIIVNVL